MLIRSTPQRPRLDDPAENRAGRSKGISWGTVGLGVVGIAGACGPAAAQVQVTPQPEEPIRLNLVDQVRLSHQEPAQWSVSASQQNDSMPGWLEWVPTNDANRIPGKRQFDDNGWTAEVRLQATRTQGDEQWTGGVRYSMLTQRGSWAPAAPEYRGYRTDLGEVVVQHNQRVELGNGSTLYYGVGGGVQAIGDLGGHRVQEQFHIHGGFGGRTGSALQTNNTTPGTATVTPLVTAGVRLDQPLQLRDWSLRSSLYSSVALGQGMSSLQGQMGLNYQASSRLNVEGGVMAAGVYSNHPAMDFLHQNGVRPGAYVESNYQVSKHVRAFGRVQTGGIQGEPVYTIGFAIGGGPGPWISPGFN
ncbi:MAG: hypothetical protein J0I12_00770 [Candidatus Eremiobacteraeota bacterium]|nr:hypothetical protein [Candidatus Eremiobacteraeota bacterium]